jgi:hypothetical protein
MEIYNASQAAKYVGVATYTVVRSAKKNKIGKKISGIFIFTKDELKLLKLYTPIRKAGCPLFNDPEFQKTKKIKKLSEK